MRWLGCKGASCGKYNHILCAPGSTLHVCDPEELHSVNVRIRVNCFSYYCWVIQCLQSDHLLWMSPCLHSSFWKRPLRFRWEQIINCMRVDVRPNSLLSFPRHTWQRVASASRVPGVLLWISSLSLSAPSLPPGTHSILFPPLLPSNFLYLSVCLSVLTLFVQAAELHALSLTCHSVTVVCLVTTRTTADSHQRPLAKQQCVFSHLTPSFQMTWHYICFLVYFPTKW